MGAEAYGSAWIWYDQLFEDTRQDAGPDGNRCYAAALHCRGRFVTRLSKRWLTLSQTTAPAGGAGSSSSVNISIPLQGQLLPGIAVAELDVGEAAHEDVEDGEVLIIVAFEPLANTAHCWRLACSGVDVDIRHTEHTLTGISCIDASASVGIFNHENLEGLALGFPDGRLLQLDVSAEQAAFSGTHTYLRDASSSAVGFTGLRSIFSSKLAFVRTGLDDLVSSHGSATLPGYLFTVSAADRRLEAWSTLSCTCVASIELPFSPATMEIVPYDGGSSGSSASGPPLNVPLRVRFVRSDRNAGYLLVHIPTSDNPQTSFFILYALAADQDGNLEAVTAVQEIPCDFAIPSSSSSSAGEAISQLVDFLVVPSGDAPSRESSLWTLWHENGRAIVRQRSLRLEERDDNLPLSIRARSQSPLSDSGGAAVDVLVAGNETVTQWSYVALSTSQHVRSLSRVSEQFDSLWEGLNNGVTEDGDTSQNFSLQKQKIKVVLKARQAAGGSFLSHIFEPRKFSITSIRGALQSYLSSSNPPSVSTSPAAQHHPPSLAQSILDIVGARLWPDADSETGALEIVRYRKAYKAEWLRFSTFVEENRREEVIPLVLGSFEGGVTTTDSPEDPNQPSAVALCTGGFILPVSKVAALLHSEERLHEPSAPAQLLETADVSSRVIFSVANRLYARLQSSGPEALVAFESACRDMLMRPAQEALEEQAATLYDDFLEALIDDELVQDIVAELDSAAHSHGRDVATMIADAIAVIDSAPNLLAGPPQHASSQEGAIQPTAVLVETVCDLANGLVQDHYDTALSMFALLLFVQGELMHPDSNLSSTLQEGHRAHLSESDIIRTIQRASASLQTFLMAKWLCHHNIALTRIDYEPPVLRASQQPTTEHGSLEHQLAGLRVDRTAYGNPAQPFSRAEVDLLGADHSSVLMSLLRDPSYQASLARTTGSLQYASAATTSLLIDLGILGTPVASGSPLPARRPGSKAAAMVASSLYSQGLLAEASLWIEYQPSRLEDPGLSHLQAVLLCEENQKHEEALAMFRRVAATIPSPPDASATSTLPALLDSEQCSDRTAYLRLVIGIFDGQQAERQVADACKLAIDAAAGDEFSSGEARPETIGWLEQVWHRAFRALVKLGDFDEAYATIITMTDRGVQQHCLRHLVATMCESGNADLLLSYSFAGLQPALEEILGFRAKNSHPLSNPDYHKILYAWHCSRSDHRSAAATMLQRARRLANEVDDTLVLRSVTEAAQSYLSAMNSLSLVPVEKRHINIEPGRAGRDTEDTDMARSPKRLRRVLDKPEVDPSMVTLDGITSEYLLALARLQLGQDFPELLRPGQYLDRSTAVVLQTQLGHFDAALQTALALDVDMSMIFERIAERCVSISTATEHSLLSSSAHSADDVAWVNLDPRAGSWQGSTASRAWKLLNLWLDRYSPADNGSSVAPYRYAYVVLDTLLRCDRSMRLPRFLVEWFTSHDPGYLVWRLVEYDLLEDALKLASDVLRVRDTARPPRQKHLSYNIVDQLLHVDLSAEEDGSERIDVIGALQTDVRQLVQERWRKSESPMAAVR